MIRTFRVVLNGKEYQAEIEETTRTPAALAAASMPAPKQAYAPAPAPVYTAAPASAAPALAPVPAASAPAAAPKASASGGAATVITVPLPCVVLRLCVKEGDSVKKGQLIAVLEAMKMENEIYASVDGVVKSIALKEGASANTGDELMQIG